MATTDTSTLRVPTELRDRIAQLASARRSTMIAVVDEAVAELARQEWWRGVHTALDEWSEDDVDDYAAETTLLDPTLSDGLT